MDKTLIREIAKKNYLNTEQQTLLINLITKRFPNEQSLSYVSEWAARISKGTAWAHADTKTQKVLIELGVTE